MKSEKEIREEVTRARKSYAKRIQGIKKQVIYLKSAQGACLDIDVSIAAEIEERINALKWVLGE